MSTPPSLCNLPNELAINIFNRVGFKSIQNLRKVCRDLRIRIDDIKPEANLLRVSIEITDDKIEIIYQSQIQILDVEKSEDPVHYEKTVDSERCIVRSDRSEKIVNGDFMELALRDLQLILKFQKKIIKYTSFYNRTEYSNNFLQFSETLKSFLEFENRLLKVFNLHILTNDQKSVITSLSLIDPQSIYSIRLFKLNGNNRPMNIAEIIEMEQWKNAKDFVSDFIITGISEHNFRHFSVFDVNFQSISAKYLLDLKKIFQNSTDAKHFQIWYKTFKHRKQFFEKMGPPVTVYDKFEWYFRMSTTDDDVLCIQLSDRFGEITFYRCLVHDVPEDAVIQNE